MKRILLLCILVLSLIPTAEADIISINSGGNEEIIITPNNIIEGIFTFLIPNGTTTPGTPPGGGPSGPPYTAKCQNYTLISFVSRTNAPMGLSNYTVQVLNGEIMQRFYVYFSDNMKTNCFIAEMSNYKVLPNVYAEIRFECYILNGTKIGNATLATDTSCAENHTIVVSKSEGVIPDIETMIEYLKEGKLDVAGEQMTSIGGFDMQVWVLVCVVIILIILAIVAYLRMMR